jgi:hypothetical protein
MRQPCTRILPFGSSVAWNDQRSPDEAGLELLGARLQAAAQQLGAARQRVQQLGRVGQAVVGLGPTVLFARDEDPLQVVDDRLAQPGPVERHRRPTARVTLPQPLEEGLVLEWHVGPWALASRHAFGSLKSNVVSIAPPESHVQVILR